MSFSILFTLGSFDVQPIWQILEYLPAETASWLLVVACFAGSAVLVRWDQRRKDRREKVKPVSAPVHFSYADGPVGICQPPAITEQRDVRSLHADAEMQIDAAEHALNRLRADYAQVSTAPVPPVVEEVPKPASEPAPARPLAA